MGLPGPLLTPGYATREQGTAEPAVALLTTDQPRGSAGRHPALLSSLPSGLRVVTEPTPGAASVALGFFVGTGSRDEPDGLAGSSHFLEHLLFKGTATRSARDIAEAVDAVGGDLNAYTSAEHTAFQARLPAHALELGLDLLSEVVWSPALRPADVEAERTVILEELAMEEDTPEDRVLTLLADALFPDHPLGREVLGTRTSLASLGPGDIASFHERWYRPANVVVAASGAVDHDALCACLERRLSVVGGEAPVRSAPTQPPRRSRRLRRQTEQAHVALGIRALARGDDDRWALAVANQVLGGGPASRLFQSIREERGLAYSVGSWTEAHTDAGALVAHAGTGPGQVREVRDLLERELEALVIDGITGRELAVAVGYLTGSTVLALEDPGSRMARIGDSVLATGRVAPLDDVLDSFRAVTQDDVTRAVRRVVAPAKPTVAVLAPTAR